MARTVNKRRGASNNGASSEERGARRLALLRTMMHIRRFEEKAAEMYAKGRIKGFLHLYIGQEGVATGAISALHPDDYLVTHYREHGHALARGLDPNAIMAELFGRSGGTTGGRGGSMHIFDASKSFMGGYAIVAGHMPLACGLALSSTRAPTASPSTSSVTARSTRGSSTRPSTSLPYGSCPCCSSSRTTSTGWAPTYGASPQ
jgi:TPP-dependent pyruvate/acetoin dehydrogenase alpha subunit